jgi:regulator of replication initiation timing
MGLNIFTAPSSHKEDGMGVMVERNERVQLEMKIMRYRLLARQTSDDETTQRIKALIAELEQKLREIDE